MKPKLANVLQMIYATLAATDKSKGIINSVDAHGEDIFQFGDGMGLTSMTVLPCTSLCANDLNIIELQDMKMHPASA